MDVLFALVFVFGCFHLTLGFLFLLFSFDRVFHVWFHVVCFSILGVAVVSSVVFASSGLDMIFFGCFLVVRICLLCLVWYTNFFFNDHRSHPR